MHYLPGNMQSYFPPAILFLSFFVIIIGNSSKAVCIETIGCYYLFSAISTGMLSFKKYLSSFAPDSKHPYGYAKYSSFAQLLISISVLATITFIIGKALIRQNIADTYFVIEEHLIVIITILIISHMFMLWKMPEIQSWSAKRVYCRTEKAAFDILVSFFFLIWILLIPAYPLIDFILSILILLFLFKLSGDTIGMSINELCDHHCIPEKNISELVSQVNKVEAVHNVRTYGTEYSIYVDLHVALDPDMQLVETKQILANIEKTLMKNYTTISDVTMHIVPNSGMN